MLNEYETFKNKEEYDAWFQGLTVRSRDNFCIDPPDSYPANLKYEQIIFEDYSEFRGEYTYPEEELDKKVQLLTGFIDHLSSFSYEVREETTRQGADYEEFSIVHPSKIETIAREWLKN